MKFQFLVSLVLLSLIGVLQAQTVNPSLTLDMDRISAMNGIRNTGLSIAPGSDIHAVVHDNLNNYAIEWYDQWGNYLDSYTALGTDPDVAFDQNQDQVFVVYELSGRIMLATFSGNNGNYTLMSDQMIATGTHPNIDVNSYGFGSITWEYDQSVWACAFTATPFTLYPPTLIRADAIQPDITAMDYYSIQNLPPSQTWLTCVSTTGELVIMDLSYPLLQAGTIYSSQSQVTWYFTPTTQRFEHPRIASQKNAGFGGYKDLTVVAQDCYGSGSAVKGVFLYNGTGGFTMSNLIDINPHFSSCEGTPWPVVAYERGEVHIAWAQTYDQGCASQVFFTGMSSDVLMNRFLPDGTALGADYAEINLLQDVFDLCRPAIATRNDGVSPVSNISYHESIVYYDPDMLYSKTAFVDSPVYKTETADASIEEPSIKLLTNPASQAIQVITEGEHQYQFELFDFLGKAYSTPSISTIENQHVIDVSDLPNGIYLLHYHSDLESGAFRVIVQN